MTNIETGKFDRELQESDNSKVLRSFWFRPFPNFVQKTVKGDLQDCYRRSKAVLQKWSVTNVNKLRKITAPPRDDTRETWSHKQSDCIQK